ncbi:hypothetical protein PC121_g22412 [Phytophthora cactorum]|nr:hypothetical protein PC121_g22412 [Phytophthora cactorum]
MQKQQRLYDELLSRQRPAVEWREYPVPTAVDRRPRLEGAEPELTCAERWVKIDAAAEASAPTVDSGVGVKVTHTGVSGSDSSVLSSAEGPCDAEDGPVSAVLHTRDVDLNGAKCGGDRDRFGDRANSAEKNTTANFGVGTVSSAIMNSATTVFDPGGDRNDSAWAERSAYAPMDTSWEDGTWGPSDISLMDASTGFPATVNSASAKFDPGCDNADLKSSNQGVSLPDLACGDKGTPLADATNSATMLRLGSAEIDATEVGTHSVEDSAETLRLYYLVAVSTDEGEGDAKEIGDLNQFEHEGTDFDLADYAHELAFLPDLAEVVPTELYYDAPNVKSSCHTPEQSARLWRRV